MAAANLKADWTSLRRRALARALQSADRPPDGTEARTAPLCACARLDWSRGETIPQELQFTNPFLGGIYHLLLDK